MTVQSLFCEPRHDVLVIVGNSYEWGSIEEIINSDFSIPYSSKSLYDTPKSMKSFVESVVGSRCAM